jgi:hypothetical protein
LTRRTSHIRPPDDRNVDRLLVFAFTFRREPLHHGIEQVAARLPDRGRDRQRIPEPELEEREVRGRAWQFVELVHDQEDRPARASKLGGDLGIDRIQALCRRRRTTTSA